MINLNHVEVGDPEGISPEDGTLVRFWQAEIPGTGLFAITEEGFTQISNSMFGKRHMHLTRFFVTEGPWRDYFVYGRILSQDELNHGDHFDGPIGPAIRALTGPTPWIDTPRQRMLEVVIESYTNT